MEGTVTGRNMEEEKLIILIKSIFNMETTKKKRARREPPHKIQKIIMKEWKLHFRPSSLLL